MRILLLSLNLPYFQLLLMVHLFVQGGYQKHWLPQVLELALPLVSMVWCIGLGSGLWCVLLDGRILSASPAMLHWLSLSIKR